ncbi:MAG: FAD-dependent oxidoreductase [Rhodospirillales bacterium]|jgi:NADH dehydrogenase
MQNILVIGGGFAGLSAALNGADQVRQHGGEIAVTVVSNSEYITMRPRLYEVNPQNLREPLRPIFDAAGIPFKCAEARAIDPVARTVELNAPNGEPETLSYDRLILTAGSRLKSPPVPGLAENSWNIDSYDGAVAFDEHLQRITNGGSAPGSGTFVIIGAGITGIEFALEMRTRIDAHGNTDAAKNARIVLIDRAPVIGPDIGDNPRPVITEALDEGGVETLLGRQVQAAAADHLTLDDGTRIKTASVIVTTGLVANRLGADIGGTLDEIGRLHVDDNLSVKGRTDIFAAGDMAHASADDTHVALMSCQHAGTMGKYAGYNAARDLLGLPLRRYRQPNYTTCIDLGEYGAMYSEGWEREVKTTGAEANARKRMINEQWIYPPQAGTAEDIFAARRIDENGR